MRKITQFTFALALVVTGASCAYHHGDTEISYTEDESSYSMKAYFPDNKMRNVEHYLDSRIGDNSKMSFVNTRIDGDLALDDHTTFYIKKSSGELEIKLDKDKNSPESFHEIKSLCEGIKKVLGN